MRNTARDWYIQHGPLTDPGPHSAALDTLPDDIGALVGIVQGLLIHDAGLHLYGLSTADFEHASRTTLPISDRLTPLLASAPLLAKREPINRVFGTCRDYALMLTAFLRHKDVPSRVRCGFAAYFRSNPYDDHWICEYRHSGDQRWHRADAQLDGPHRSHLDIDFDPIKLPDGAFLTAAEAWRLVRSGAVDAGCFGHGASRGEWFMRVNLVRDLLALTKQETSYWDDWRSASPETHPSDEHVRAECDSIAEAAGAVDRTLDAVVRPEPAMAQLLRPFWH